MPHSGSIIYSAAEPGHAPRTYLLDIHGGAPRALTPENTLGSLVSPDGNFLLAMDGNRQRWLYPVFGGDPRKLSVVFNPNERAMGFSADGNSVLVRTVTIPVQISRVDLATGKREHWKEIVPADPAGVQAIPIIRFSADGKSYAYSVGRILSDLYVVDGLKSRHEIRWLEIDGVRSPCEASRRVSPKTVGKRDGYASPLRQPADLPDGAYPNTRHGNRLTKPGNSEGPPQRVLPSTASHNSVLFPVTDNLC
jgi:hypothetical protein